MTDILPFLGYSSYTTTCLLHFDYPCPFLILPVRLPLFYLPGQCLQIKIVPPQIAFINAPVRHAVEGAALCVNTVEEQPVCILVRQNCVIVDQALQHPLCLISIEGLFFPLQPPIFTHFHYPAGCSCGGRGISRLTAALPKAQVPIGEPYLRAGVQDKNLSPS